MSVYLSPLRSQILQTKRKKKLNSTSVLTPRLPPSHSGSPFSGALCFTALQMRGVNPCVCTHRSSLPSLTSLIPPGEQSSPGDGAHSVGKAESHPEALCSSCPGTHSPLRAPHSALGSLLPQPSQHLLKEGARRGKTLRGWKASVKCWVLISLPFLLVFQLNPLRLSTQSWEILETLNPECPHFTCACDFRLLLHH